MQPAILCLSRETSLGSCRSPSVCLPLGFIVSNTHEKIEKNPKQNKESQGKQVCKTLHWAFSCWFPSFSVAAVTFKKLLIHKMNTAEKHSSKFTSQTDTCCRWQMLCCGPNEFFFSLFFEGDIVPCGRVECSCFVLDRCPSATTFIISLKGSSSHYDRECRWIESLKEERNGEGKEHKVGQFVFHTAQWAGQLCSLTHGWKSSRS